MESEKAELRWDPLQEHWVLYSVGGMPPLGIYRKNDTQRENCPFCPGNEALSPGESATVGDDCWQMRAFPAAHPAVMPLAAPEKIDYGPYVKGDAIGVHEIVVESRDHDIAFADLSLLDMEKAIRLWQQRAAHMKALPRVAWIGVMKNHQAQAGGSISHVHSQILALPVAPAQILRELSAGAKYDAVHNRCLHCDILEFETLTKGRVVAKNDNFIAFCPYASRRPYEVRIYPVDHRPDFTMPDTFRHRDLASVLKDALTGIRNALGDPGYNLMLVSVPTRMNRDLGQPERYHWRLDIIPRAHVTQAIEVGVGMFINPVRPEVAAEKIRSGIAG